ncbi:TPA: DUF4365 domain-containing protein [Bacillus cereus]|nr:DUF4365 domain-containing protein [Bacillus cereus]HDR4624548.1 DUF4365 domain-containing protein [Bacillus cereus]HDR4659260.1 DUF4365 domain-containing protein [Bacillus cereus]HDR4927147.1 DUF4365 domain-containing protein [Bacillus cereus]HDR4933758.1 DUF4365 domain-containing protein [Bacillus cereus]
MKGDLMDKYKTMGLITGKRFNKGLKLPNSGRKSHKGKVWELEVLYLFYAKLHWLYTDIPHENDLGIDGLIEVLDNERRPTGQALGIQCKRGKSYRVTYTNDSNIYIKVKIEHVNYWRSHNLPIIIMIDFEGKTEEKNKEKYWVYFEPNIIQYEGVSCILRVPKENRIKEDDPTFLHQFSNELTKICDSHNPYQRKLLSLYTVFPILKNLMDNKGGIAVVTTFQRVHADNLVQMEFSFYDKDLRPLNKNEDIIISHKKNWKLEDYLEDFGTFDVIDKTDLDEKTFQEELTYQSGNESDTRNGMPIGVKINKLGEYFLTLALLLDKK